MPATRLLRPLQTATRRFSSTATSSLPSSVRLVEVSARDGLQALKNPILTTSQKLEYLNKLTASGLTHIEAGSFVNPKTIPQMANSGSLMGNLPAGPLWSFLTPNQRGLDAFLAHNPDLTTTEIAVFVSATEEFSMRNLGRPRDKAMADFGEVVRKARETDVKVRGYVSMVIACPFSGPTDPKEVGDAVEKLLGMGCYEVSLGDTNGFGTPKTVRALLHHLVKERGVSVDKLAGHFHDTYGMAVANVQAAAEEGVAVFDGSVGGLGGCPFAGPGAAGNVATEELVWLFEKQGVKTGVNIEKLIEAGRFMSGLLQRQGESKVARALMGKRTVTQEEPKAKL
ncbi:pyruvate carboxyltransferase [Ascodesmis nigricans]|uniref:hydroxymethylglutaryl-CoA lyase n=1 Tax=Ascodesmis nigricans TaxID=341454 RepID=A0A4S2N8C4_9PEZI|nr:pyruvate carboxyltransferase [Ascodesmis nigricans]